MRATALFTRWRSLVRSQMRQLNLAVREPWDAAGSAPDAPAVGCGRGDLQAGLKVRAVRSEFVLGVGKERLKRAEKVAAGRCRRRCARRTDGGRSPPPTADRGW